MVALLCVSLILLCLALCAAVQFGDCLAREMGAGLALLPVAIILGAMSVIMALVAGATR